MANGEFNTMPFGIWKGVVWIVGPNDLVTIEDLKELRKPKKQRKPVKKKITKLQAKIVMIKHTRRSRSIADMV